MKTFKEFLFEAEKKVIKQSEEQEEIFKIFDRMLGPAKPYIEKNKATLKRGIFLIRGMDAIETNKGIDQFNTRQDRRPRDTDIDIHNKVGAWFKEKFSVNYRVPVVFCRQTKEDLEYYGEPHIILPCGVHKFCFSPKVFDLTLYVDPAQDHTAYQKLLTFCSSGLKKYLPIHTLPDFEHSLGDVLFGLFAALYWTASEESFKNLDEKYSFPQFNNFFTYDRFYSDSIDAFADYVITLRMHSKVQTHDFMTVLLATLGFKSVDHFKETMVRIGNDYLNSLGYKETEDQTTIRPLRNEVMVYCKSFIVIPFEYNKLFKEYVNEKF